MGSAGLPAVRSRRHNFRCAACALLPSLCRLHTKKTQHCGRRGRVGVARRADDRRHVVSALISRFATCTATANGWMESANRPRRVRRRFQGWMITDGRPLALQCLAPSRAARLPHERRASDPPALLACCRRTPARSTAQAQRRK
jgi:hypothetical protein